MPRKAFRLLLLAALCLPFSTLAQKSSASSKSNETPGSAWTPYLIKEYSRMVTLDVVVENRKGHHIRGLKTSDFQVFEGPIESKKMRLQKIADLQEIHTAALRAPVEAPANLPPGVYTNAVQVQKDPVPPTVLLVDGINTPLQYQAQVHVQMLKMLRQLPPNIPVAVLLMGDRLRVLQSFTTNHELLQQALAKAESATGQGLEHLNPADNPNSIGSLLASASASGGAAGAGAVAAARQFDQFVYAADNRERFNRTYDAFLSIARSLEGYPGRKNVLWMSTSFPLTLNVSPQEGDLAHLDFQQRMQVLSNVLDKAKVAIYPVDIGGVRTLQVYTAEGIPVNSFAGAGIAEDGLRILNAGNDQIGLWENEQSAMLELAKATGGKACMGENNLAKCVQKAVHDSSDFYEISYYPNSVRWNGEYQRILVKVKRHGARLSYRRGYYATSEGRPDAKTQAIMMWESCGDLLNATGIGLTAKTLPSHRLTFRLDITPSDLTFTPTTNGKRMLNAEVAICTYNRRGWPQKLVAYPLNLSLNDKVYSTLMSGGHLFDSIYVPGPKPSAIRLLVKDVPSGKLGSIYIRTAQLK